MSPSIPEYFEGKHVLLTGVTGFVGKCLLEKLLRSCPGVGKVYVVIRAKRGSSSQQRLMETLNSKVFDRLRSTTSEREILSKLKLISGEMTQPNFGLVGEELEVITTNVQILVHSAANIAFTMPLQRIAQLNVGGTRNVLQMAVSMPKLEAFIFVSTAYSNPPHVTIEERVYPTLMEPDKLIDLFQHLPKAWSDAIEPIALSGFPTTYAYSKHLAEKLVDSYSQKLPACIIRPGASRIYLGLVSLYCSFILGLATKIYHKKLFCINFFNYFRRKVLAAYEEPFPGWNEVHTSISTYYKTVFDGTNFSPNCNPDLKLAIAAMDYTVNLILSAAWKLGQSTQKGILVFNQAKNAISYKDSYRIGSAVVRENRYKGLSWYPNPISEKSTKMHLLKNFIFRMIPALVYDLVFRPRNDKSMWKTIRYALMVNYAFQAFGLNEWTFGPSLNTKALANEMDEDDRRVFPIDLDAIDWEEFIKRFAKGIYAFDPDQKVNLQASRARMLRLRAMDLGIKFVVLLVLPVLVVYLIYNTMGDIILFRSLKRHP